MVENRTGRTEPVGERLDDVEKLFESREADGCEGCGSVYPDFEVKEIDKWIDGEPAFLTSCRVCDARDAAEADRREDR